mmetsp:Transcript_31132/g.77482  ORF Transcript_31132/g.77482 Transcript_31132/m.77482 type:complete len:86 (+) Transcript_31132:505-762(+)
MDPASQHQQDQHQHDEQHQPQEFYNHAAGNTFDAGAPPSGPHSYGSYGSGNNNDAGRIGGYGAPEHHKKASNTNSGSTNIARRTR